MQPPGLRIEQIFLVHSHFQHREGHFAMPVSSAAGEQQIEVQLEVFELATAEGDRRAGVSVRVMTNESSEHPYIFDVKMSAVIASDPGSANLDARVYAITAGATMLYPFIREAVANLTTRGRFGTTWLHPYNMQAAVASLLAQDTARRSAGAAQSAERT